MLKMSEGANFRDKVKRKVKQENVFRQPNHVEVEKRFGIGRTVQLTSLVQIESQSNLGQAEAVELYVFGQRRQI